MKLAVLALTVVALGMSVSACSGESSEELTPPGLDEPEEEVISGPDVDTSVEAALPPEADEDPFADDPALEAAADAEIDTGIPADAPEADPELDLDLDELAPTAARCKKHITVIATVGVPGLSKYRTNGCWKVIITDGAALPDKYRKCSTSDFKVHNKKAPSYAYDDTSPSHSLSAEKSFLRRCSSGATGVGWEFMAYRSGWRLLKAPRLRAYFGELYGGSMRDIDSLWYVRGVYRGNAALARHTRVFPMINFGTPKAANLHRRIAAETLKICRTVKNRGFFGLYNASWREGMPIDDPRLRAVQRGLNACTRR